MRTSAAPVLACSGLVRTFGALRAVDGVDLALPAGARHALIGPNGAGKSTLFQLLAGGVAPSAGRVWLDGRDVTPLSDAQRARLGIGQTFQHASLFPSMTAAQNVALAAERALGVAWRPVPRRALWPQAGDRAQDRIGARINERVGARISERVGARISERIDELLGEVDLLDRRDRAVAALSHGERRQLELAVALAAAPRVILLDEPAAGLSQAETERLAALVHRLPASLTLLFVEHDLDLVFRLATRVTVLHLGKVLVSGTPAEVQGSAEVQEAYLGTGRRGDLFLAAAPAAPASADSAPASADAAPPSADAAPPSADAAPPSADAAPPSGEPAPSSDRAQPAPARAHGADRAARTPPVRDALEIRGLRAGYGEGTVLSGVELSVRPGRITALLGRNGVGKTTLVMSVMGLVRAAAGSVRLGGIELAGRRPDEIARAGIGLVPQGRRIWPTLTVHEHLALAARSARRIGRWIDPAELYRQLPRLAERRTQLAGQMSGGEQQMLAIARALIARPRVVLLDEPSEGLAPRIVDQIGAMIRTLTDTGVAVLLVEQDLHLAFGIADEIAVMARGAIVHRSPTATFRRDPATAHRLLGIEA